MPTVDERWLPIPGYEGRYDVSDLGHVRSWITAGVPLPAPRATPLDTKGYPNLRLRSGTAVTNCRVHQLVLLAFIGTCPSGMEVRHLDGDRTNNRLANLTYGTPSENQYDRVRHGTHPLVRRTHCSNGHEFTPENTRLVEGRGRCCRACRRIYRRAYKLRRAARRVAA